MGAIQGSINRIIGSVSAGLIAGKKMSEKSQDKEPNIDMEMRKKALKTAQKKIDAINAQKLGRNTRMKEIRKVVDEFSQQDFTKGGKK